MTFDLFALVTLIFTIHPVLLPVAGCATLAAFGYRGL
jgi:hypothetical protein